MNGNLADGCAPTWWARFVAWCYTAPGPGRDRRRVPRTDKPLEGE